MSKSRKNKRHHLAIIFVICMLIGLIAQLLVAWGFALYGDQSYSGLIGNRIEPWGLYSPPDWPDTELIYESTQSDHLGCNDAAFLATENLPTSPDNHVFAIVVRSGLPYRAWQWGMMYRSPEMESIPPRLLDRGIPAPWIDREVHPDVDNRRLPVSPVWPGVAYNQLIYTLIPASLWLAVRGTRSWFRWRRRRRNHCQQCGYTLDSGMSLCPECGMSVGRRGAHQGGGD